MHLDPAHPKLATCERDVRYGEDDALPLTGSNRGPLGNMVGVGKTRRHVLRGRGKRSGK